MEYDVKKRIEACIVDSNYPDDFAVTMLKQLDEVYAKAKAFNEVIKKVETEFVSEDLADSIRILVNDHEYDMEDK